MTAVPPFKESSRELIVEVARALEPYFPDITSIWREKLAFEFGFDGKTLAALERLTLAAGCVYFLHQDFPGFQENLHYFGTRLSKLQVDTRAVARCLELYSLSCDPYLSGLFPDREAEAKAALEMLSSVSFVIISGAYFDAKTLESFVKGNLGLAAMAAQVKGMQKVVEHIGISSEGASVKLVAKLDMDDVNQLISTLDAGGSAKQDSPPSSP